MERSHLNRLFRFLEAKKFLKSKVSRRGSSGFSS
jgi:hypothetical protein